MWIAASCPCGKAGRGSRGGERRSLRAPLWGQRRRARLLLPARLIPVHCRMGSDWRSRAYRDGARTPRDRPHRCGSGRAYANMLAKRGVEIERVRGQGSKSASQRVCNPASRRKANAGPSTLPGMPGLAQDDSAKVGVGAQCRGRFYLSQQLNVSQIESGRILEPRQRWLGQ